MFDNNVPLLYSLFYCRTILNPLQPHIRTETDDGAESDSHSEDTGATAKTEAGTRPLPSDSDEERQLEEPLRKRLLSKHPELTSSLMFSVEDTGKTEPE